MMPRSSNRLNEGYFKFRIPAALKAEFKAATEADNRPAAEVIREFMRSYVERHKPEPGYDEWFRREIQESLDDDSPGIPHEEVMREMREILEARIAKAAKRED
jgi:hypothetical protein